MYAAMNTRNIQNNTNTSQTTASTMANKANVNTSAGSTQTVNAKPGSMMAKANMVKQYNERNNKDNE